MLSGIRKFCDYHRTSQFLFSFNFLIVSENVFKSEAVAEIFSVTESFCNSPDANIELLNYNNFMDIRF